MLHAENLTNDELANFLTFMEDVHNNLTDFEKSCLIEASKRIEYLDRVERKIRKMVIDLERRTNVHSE